MHRVCLGEKRKRCPSIFISAQGKKHTTMSCAAQWQRHKWNKEISESERARHKNQSHYIMRVCVYVRMLFTYACTADPP
jgi:hypothetical protein